MHAGEALAIFERRPADAGDTVADGNTVEAGATTERIMADAGDAVADGYAGEAGAITERLITDAGDALGNNNISCRLILDACYCTGILGRSEVKCLHPFI